MHRPTQRKGTKPRHLQPRFGGERKTLIGLHLLRHGTHYGRALGSPSMNAGHAGLREDLQGQAQRWPPTPAGSVPSCDRTAVRAAS